MDLIRSSKLTRGTVVRLLIFEQPESAILEAGAICELCRLLYGRNFRPGYFLRKEIICTFDTEYEVVRPHTPFIVSTII